MRTRIKLIALALAFSLGQTPVGAAPSVSRDGVWHSFDQAPAEKANLPAWVRPAKFRPARLNVPALRASLAKAPVEIELPMPDGTFARFHIEESPIMEPALAAKFPEIKTYSGRGLDDPSATIRCDITPAGFHAQILSPRGAVYIDPYSRGDDTFYASYYKRDHRRQADGWQCFQRGDEANAPAIGGAMAGGDMVNRSGTALRTYRLACAATGEYTAFHGGTVASGMAAIVTAINRVTGVYESELSIRLVLVANNDLIVYTNSATDPYTNNSGSTMLGQNQTTCDNVIGSANYDIGHVFSTGGGGVAYLGVVCANGSKGGGVTGSTSPVGDAFYIDYVAHEMGHQFGANHTFNSTTSNCGGGNRNATTAYEPGSGSTIMAYAGICGADDLQPNSDPYFHSASFDEIIAYSTSGGGNGCAVQTATSNTVPTVSAGPNFTIPARTPFTLTAIGNDADGDSLTYCWEERDLGPATTLSAGDNGSSPLFRSFNPTNSPARTFPKLSAILTGAPSLGEKLPTSNRTMSFRVTARDNRPGGGGVNTSDMTVTVISNAGPFLVTAPGSNAVWSGAQTVTWNVAGTATAPINTTTVNIRLSTDGGQTFPVLLATNTPNDGAELVVLPNISNTTARVKVEATGNIFFDISDTNFTITNSSPAALLVADAAVLEAESCPPGNNAVDPNETVTMSFVVRNVGSLATTNVVGTLLVTGGVLSPSGPQNYGTIPAGGARTNSFTFTVSGSCGAALTASLQLQDGPVDMGTVAYPVMLGAVTGGSVTSSNASAFTIPATGNSGISSLYPSTINVSGVTGPVTKVVARLNGLSHTWPDDLDVLLVSPAGQKVMLMSDGGGGNSISGLTLTFDDEASGALPDSSAIVSGTYRPTDFAAGETMTAPAPAGPYSTAMSSFNGYSPNGTWSLYILDDQNPDKGSLSGGWTLMINTATTNCCSGGPVFYSLTTGKVGTGSGAITSSPAGIDCGSDCEQDYLSNTVVTVTAQADVSSTFMGWSGSTNTPNAIVAVTMNEAKNLVADFALNWYPLTVIRSGSGTGGIVSAPAGIDCGGLCETNFPHGTIVTLAATAGEDSVFAGWSGDCAGTGSCEVTLTGARVVTGTFRLKPMVSTVAVNGADFAVSFSTENGATYAVQYRDSLTEGTWEILTNNVAGTGGVISILDEGAASLTQRFYRTVLSVP
jgi:subtilisin-like proprotein convertase family protein